MVKVYKYIQLSHSLWKETINVWGVARLVEMYELSMAAFIVCYSKTVPFVCRKIARLLENIFDVQVLATGVNIMITKPTTEPATWKITIKRFFYKILND